MPAHLSESGPFFTMMNLSLASPPRGMRSEPVMNCSSCFFSFSLNSRTICQKLLGFGKRRGGREGGREEGREGEERRKGGERRKEGRKEGREGEREGRREEGREEGGRKGGRERGREGGRKGGRREERFNIHVHVCPIHIQVYAHTQSCTCRHNAAPLLSVAPDLHNNWVLSCEAIVASALLQSINIPLLGGGRKIVNE